MNTTAQVLAYIAGGLVSLTAIVKLGIVPVYHAVQNITTLVERLGTVETQTRQLTHNGGTHMRDDVATIRQDLTTYIVEDAVQKKVLALDLQVERDTVRASLDEQAEHVRTVLDEQAEHVRTVLVKQEKTVRDALDEHSIQFDAEIKDVWKTLATRDIHKSADTLNLAAERAERAQPSKEKPTT